MLGKVLFNSLIETDQKEAIIKPQLQLPSGIYLVEAVIDGNVYRKKLMVE